MNNLRIFTFKFNDSGSSNFEEIEYANFVPLIEIVRNCAKWTTLYYLSSEKNDELGYVTS